MNILDPIVLNSSVTDSTLQRRLQETGEGPDNGTVAVLVIVCILFCFIWTPVMVRRCRGNPDDPDDQDLARFEAEARAVRATLERMSVFSAADPSRTDLRLSGACMSLEDRREFVDNALLIKKVIVQDSEKEVEHSTSSKEKDVDETLEQEQSSVHKDEDVVMYKEKGDLIVSRRVDRQTGKLANFLVFSSDGESKICEKEVEPCPICLSDYEDGEEICWAQNKQCHHVFHRDCIAQWLLTHEECPCCRQVFLMFWDDEEEQERPRLPDSMSSSSRPPHRGRTTRHHIHTDQSLGVLLRNAVMDENAFSLFYQLPAATRSSIAGTAATRSATQGGPAVIRTRVRRTTDPQQRLPLTEAQRVWERVVMEMARPLADELVNRPTTTATSTPARMRPPQDSSTREDVETGRMPTAATTTTTTSSSSRLRAVTGPQVMDSQSEGGVTVDLDEIPLNDEDDTSMMAPPSMAVIDSDRSHRNTNAATTTTTTTRRNTTDGGDSVMTTESEEC